MARTKIEKLNIKRSIPGTKLKDIADKQAWPTKRILEEYWFAQDENTRSDIVKIVKKRESLKDGTAPENTMLEEYLAAIAETSFITEERVIANRSYYESYIDIDRRLLTKVPTYDGREAQGYTLEKGLALYINTLIQFDAVGLGALIEDKIIKNEGEARVLLLIYFRYKISIEQTPRKSDSNAARKGIVTRRQHLKDLKSRMSDRMQQYGISKTQSNILAAKLLQYTV